MQNNGNASGVQGVKTCLADLLAYNAAGSALDLPVDLTIFPDRFALSKKPERLSLRVFAQVVRETNAPSKAGLKMVRLSSFGNERSEAGSYRTACNERYITGLIVEHDAETVNMAQAAAWAREAGVAAILYASSSSRPEAPRWRALLPLEHPLHAESDRPMFETLAGRAQAIFRNTLADTELYQRALSFYFGNSGQPDFQVLEIEGKALDAAGNIAPIPRPKGLKIKDAATSTSPLPVSDAFVEAVLDHIPNDTALRDLPANDRLAQGYTGLFSQVGFGLWRQYRDNPEQGCAMFHDWASRNPDYTRKTTQDRWRGLDNNGAGGRYTLLGLIQIAEQHGFNRAEYDYDWGEDYEDDLPARSTTDLTELLGGAAKTLKPEIDNPVTALNRDHAAVMIGGKFRIIREKGTEYDVFAPEELHKLNANNRVKVPGEKRTEPVTSAWMRHPSRRTFAGGLVFNPKETPAGGL